MEAGHLASLVETCYRRHPELSGKETVTRLFDEIQAVPGRGGGHPSLQLRGISSAPGRRRAGAAAGDVVAERPSIERSFLEYLATGRFPEAQGIDAPARLQLLDDYVDAAVLRDD
jgi:hypothetical protein